MKIAVINETSAADKNSDIVAALEGRDHEIINAGMTQNGKEPEISYMHTGFMTALLLNSGAADFVVGGCGTGQGYLNAAMQYPGVFCGHIITPLDAWLFTQINGGNCISLMLNQGFGWAADVNLSFIFDRIFSVERGSGYPEHRREPQKESRLLLEEVSGATHLTMAECINKLPEKVVVPAFTYPGFLDILKTYGNPDKKLAAAIEKRL